MIPEVVRKTLTAAKPTLAVARNYPDKRGAGRRQYLIEQVNSTAASD